MSEISTIIFSKDRGAQLEMLLWSMASNTLKGHRVTVLYTTTFEKSEACYAKLKKSYPEHRFVRETRPVHEHIKELVNQVDTEYTMLLCDDEIMYRTYDLDEALYAMPTVLAFSLRLGYNINYNFSTDLPEKLPEDLEQVEVLGTEYKFLRWRWDGPTAEKDFAYPMSVTDQIFHTDFLKSAIAKVPFNSVNSLEGALDGYKFMLTKPGNQRYMACPLNSVFFSLPCNLVQQEYMWNRTTAKLLDTAEAADKFLSGKVLEVEIGEVNSCHCDFPYRWKDA